LIERIDCNYKDTSRDPIFCLLHSLSLEQLTLVDIDGYEQPKGELVCVTLSFTFKFSNNFECRSGCKVTKMATKPFKF